MTSTPAQTRDGRPVAAITGAAQGIGARLATVLAEAGFALALFDRQPIATPDALCVTGDVTNPADVAGFVTAVSDRYGRVDVLVNNAAVASHIPMEELTLAEWERVMAINVTGPFLMTQGFGRLMLAAGRGSIVNIASVAGLLGVADRTAYNTSKHALVGMTRTLAVEWGGRGVRVNAVCPGWVKTEMDVASQASGAYTDRDITDHVPLGRFASTDDIAQAVLFLADPGMSGFVNGLMMSVDGGWSADASWPKVRLDARRR